jgi:hypothetical protein
MVFNDQPRKAFNKTQPKVHMLGYLRAWSIETSRSQDYQYLFYRNINCA